MSIDIIAITFLQGLGIVVFCRKFSFTSSVALPNYIFKKVLGITLPIFLNEFWIFSKKYNLKNGSGWLFLKMHVSQLLVDVFKNRCVKQLPGQLQSYGILCKYNCLWSAALPKINFVMSFLGYFARKKFKTKINLETELNPF